MEHLHWLGKAHENLAAAQLCFDHGHFNACANRLYYAMFHAGAAALAKMGSLTSTAKIGHGWLQANFARQFIHQRKVYPAKFRSYLSEAYSLRQIADYEKRIISKGNALRELKKSKEFVAAIKQEASDATQS